MRRTFLSVIAWALALSSASAHPSAPNTASQAGTIAFLHIDDHELRLELEIGPKDQAAFATLTWNDPSNFFDKTWILEADGDTLPGKIKTKEQRKRVPRDPVTGNVLQDAPPGEPVLFVDVRYPLEKKPRTIVLKPQFDPKAAPAIGLVAYHGQIAMNDFDYLLRTTSLRLDWDDRWKSHFRSLGFKRYYNSPIWGTLSLEPRAVRLEILARPGVKIEPFPELTIDGQSAKWVVEGTWPYWQSLASFEQGKGSPETEFTMTTLVARTDLRPRAVSLKWLTFDGIAEVPVYVNATDTPIKLSAKSPRYEWVDRENRTELTVDSWVNGNWRTRTKRWISGAFLLASAVLLLPRVWKPGTSRARHFVAILCGVSAILCWPWMERMGVEPVPAWEQERITGQLLKESYRAFECRDELTAYTVLEESLSATALREGYFAIRKGLELQQGSVRVKEVKLDRFTSESIADSLGFRAHCSWTVEFSITHLTHTHRRTEKFEGDISVTPDGDRWKISQLTLGAKS